MTSSDQIRVLYIVPRNTISNCKTFIERQIESLRVHNVNDNIYYLDSRTSLFSLYRSLKELKKEIQVFKPHILHAQYGTITSFIGLLCGFRPFIISFRGSDINRHKNGNILRIHLGILLSHLSSLRADRVLCVSQKIKDKTFVNTKSIVIPSGIDTEHFSQIDKTQAKKKLQWKEDEKVILFNKGAQPMTKGYDIALNAVEILKKKTQNVRMHVLDGKTDYSKMPTLLSASDCLLLTSRSEGSPNIIKEALACRTPIVSVDVGDVKEWIEGVPGCTLVKREPENIKDALYNTLSNQSKSDGIDKVFSCSLKAQAKKIAKIYRDIL